VEATADRHKKVSFLFGRIYSRYDITLASCHYILGYRFIPLRALYNLDARTFSFSSLFRLPNRVLFDSLDSLMWFYVLTGSSRCDIVQYHRSLVVPQNLVTRFTHKATVINRVIIFVRRVSCCPLALSIRIIISNDGRR
jgi:hypothetical protein